MPPIRSYACRQCGRQFRSEQLGAEPDMTTCPHCGSATLYRTEAPAIQGWGGGQQLIVNTSNKKR